MTSRTDLAAVWPVTPAAATEAGHAPMSAAQAIRQKCRDCSAGNDAEIRRCEAVSCALWPFRVGKSPWHARRSFSEGNTPLPEETEAFDGEA
jgi:hypothetical protein